MALAALAAAPAAAQAADVAFGGALGNAYAPTPVHIAPGEQVTFSGDFSRHPLRSASAEAFGHDGGEESFSHTFTTPGTYRFYCAVHGSQTGDNTVAGMSGEVIVDAAPAPAPAGGGAQPAPAPDPSPGGGGAAPSPGGEPAPAPPAASGPAAAPVVTLVRPPSLLRGALAHALVVRVRSTAAGTATARLRARGITLARAVVALPKAGEARLTLRLGRAGRALLRRVRRVSAKLTVVVAGAGGRAAPATRTVVLRR